MQETQEDNQRLAAATINTFVVDVNSLQITQQFTGDVLTGYEEAEGYLVLKSELFGSGLFYAPKRNVIDYIPQYPGVWGDDSKTYRFDMFEEKWVLIPPPEPEVVPPPTVADIPMSQFRNTDVYKGVRAKIADPYARLVIDGLIAYICGENEEVRSIFHQLAEMLEGDTQA
jgi:hypothetical protein